MFDDMFFFKKKFVWWHAPEIDFEKWDAMVGEKKVEWKIISGPWRF